MHMTRNDPIPELLQHLAHHSYNLRDRAIFCNFNATIAANLRSQNTLSMGAVRSKLDSLKKDKVAIAKVLLRDHA